jgi:hypothetical protein
MFDVPYSMFVPECSAGIALATGSSMRFEAGMTLGRQR